ncbi:X protein [Fowl aviadenovirus D]|uniref:X protein n=2 Tax=Fowl aviadenovirus D TaxID=190064 RepID=A0A650C142_9ADEN|nr:core protein precursor pX [Fowl aviadenovirus 2]QGQ63195.1 X protein [Fowl aviadenovirus D]QGQ63266.1 X protein [Fowl aviadenovirus D]BDB16223.1 pX protein [Fowl aviadenovirus D]
MPAVVLTGGRTARPNRRASTASRRRLPASKLRATRRTRRSVNGSKKKRSPNVAVAVPSPTTASAAERAALQNLATRLQRGQFTAWRSANYPAPAASEAALAAAQSGAPATARDMTTGTTATAVPVSGAGIACSTRRRRNGVSGGRTRRRGKQLKGGILPALIPIIAAAIGAIPGIAGTAVGIASLKEQQRQFNKMYNQK